MGNKKPITENKIHSSVELIKKSPNGKYYGVVRETKKYYIKESNDGSNFDFIGGVANKIKNQFESYEQAVRKLNLMLEDTDVLTPDIIIQEKKFVIKTKKKKSVEPKAEETPEGGDDFSFGGDEEESTEEGGEDFDFGGEEGGEESTEGESEDFNFGGEEETEEGSEETEESDDFSFGDEETEGTEEETTGDEDLDLDDEEDSIKYIQRMTGKLGQKLRDTDDVSSDMKKWVGKSVLSALGLEDMDSDDKKDLIRTIKKKKEGSDEESDFMKDKQVMSTPIMTYMSDDDMVDWNKLSDQEKAQIVNNGDDDLMDMEETNACSHCNGLGMDDMTGEECEWCMGTGVEDMEDYMMDSKEEDEMYGPGYGEIKSGEEIISDDDDEDNCSYCGDRDMPYYGEAEMGGYPGMEEDWMSDKDYMSRFAKNVKRAEAIKGKKMDTHELHNHLKKIQNKLGGASIAHIDDDKIVGDFGYVEVKPTGYVLHKEGEKFGKTFGFEELGKLQKYVGVMDEDYMDDPYMMPQPAPARPQTRPDTPTKPAKPGTDKPSPSKRPFTPPPHITPGEEPNPKAEYDEYGDEYYDEYGDEYGDEYYGEYGDEYGDEYYGPTEGMSYMEDEKHGYYGSFEPNKWFTPMDVEGSIDPFYEYEEFEYPDYESFRSSEFGTDPENKWFAQGEKGKVWFNKYKDKFGPMKVRKKTEIDFDKTSKMFDDLDHMEDDSMEMCSACEGKGHEYGSIGFGRQTNPCITCAGTGMIPRMEMDGEVDEPYTDDTNPMYGNQTTTLPKGMGARYQYKEKFTFPFGLGENSKSNKKTLKEDHLNNKMVSYEQDMAYEDVENMARQHGMDVEFCHKDMAKDPEEQTIYLDLMKKGKSVAKIRINTAGDIEMGSMRGKVFKGEPVDSHSDFDEVLDEKGIKMMPQPAPSRPQTRPETPTKPAPTKPGTDKPSPSKRPFTPPPHITPGEEPNPKAGTKRRKPFSYMDDSKNTSKPSIEPTSKDKPKRPTQNPPHIKPGEDPTQTMIDRMMKR